MSRAPVERELRAWCAAIPMGYVDRWWGPSALLLVSAVVFYLVERPAALPDPLVDQLVSWCFNLETGGFLVAALGNFIRRRWRTGLAQLVSLPGCLLAMGVECFALYLLIH